MGARGDGGKSFGIMILCSTSHVWYCCEGVYAVNPDCNNICKKYHGVNSNLNFFVNIEYALLETLF